MRDYDELVNDWLGGSKTSSSHRGFSTTEQEARVLAWAASLVENPSPWSKTARSNLNLVGETRRCLLELASLWFNGYSRDDDHGRKSIEEIMVKLEKLRHQATASSFS